MEKSCFHPALCWKLQFSVVSGAHLSLNGASILHASLNRPQNEPPFRLNASLLLETMLVNAKYKYCGGVSEEARKKAAFFA